MNPGLPASPAPGSAAVIGVGNVRIERKTFSFRIDENPRGKFLRITEEVGGRFDSIVVPLSGVEQVRAAIESAIHPSQQPVRATNACATSNAATSCHAVRAV
jgi:hypothetical protein